MVFRDINPVIQEDLDLIASSSLHWSDLTGKTFLVTGGGGLLASYLVKGLIIASQLYDLNLKVICIARGRESIDKRLHSFIHHPDLSVVLHDISLPLPSSLPVVDFIIHSASQASPRFYDVDPVGTILPNTAGTLHLLRHAMHNNSRFLFFSSGEIYGNQVDLSQSISESFVGSIDPLNIRSCYAESKRIGETMCAAWHRQYDLHTVIVRPFHTYGPGIRFDDGRVFADFVSDVVMGQNIILKSDGLSRRSFCYIADATIGFLTVLLKGSPGEAYNVANPYADISIRDLAYKLSAIHPKRRVGVNSEVEPQSMSSAKSSLLMPLPSINKISALGWQPKVNLDEGFFRTIHSYIILE